MERRIDLSFHFCPFSIVLSRHNWSSYSNRYFSLLRFIVARSLVFWVPNSKPTSLFYKPARYLYLKDLLCKERLQFSESWFHFLPQPSVFLSSSSSLPQCSLKEISHVCCYSKIKSGIWSFLSRLPSHSSFPCILSHVALCVVWLAEQPVFNSIYWKYENNNTFNTMFHHDIWHEI